MSTGEPSPGRSPSPLQEARPLHTSEIGTLKKLPDHGTEWLGSSSGVYFVNTVKRAFNAAFSEPGSADGQSFPNAEDILAGQDTLAENHQNQDVSATVSTDQFERLLYTALGELPEKSVGMELCMIFFKAYHPLFPFLHGPSFLQDVETLYSTTSESGSLQSGISGHQRPYDVRKLITFQLVINTAALSAPTLLPSTSRIKSTESVSLVAGILAARHTIPTIQVLLATELYLVSTFALRAASIVAGMVLRCIFQTGLHRCPLRYASLSPSDCELRKRIFWSAYALDRHLALSLGDPITLQDSDIDVCLSGRELHSAVPVTSSGPMLNGRVIGMHLPENFVSTTAGLQGKGRGHDIDGADEEKRRREAALTAYVQYSRLTGRVIEIFHKSIHARFPKREAIVYLTSDIETWWNELPDFLSGENDSTTNSLSGAGPTQRSLAPFFSVLYQQLLLLLNRPALSLDPTSAEFAHGLQVCIKASRTTLSSLNAHQHPSRAQSMFLPGLLSATWMAGLIIAFACLLGKYQKARACADISSALELLQAMENRCNTARQCYLVLSRLLVDIRQRKASSTGYLALYRLERSTPEHAASERGAGEPRVKRVRTSQPANPSPATDGNGSEQSPPENTARSSVRDRWNADSNPSPVAAQQPSILWQSSSSTDIDSSNSIAAHWNAAQSSSAYPGFNPGYTSSGFSGVPDYSFSSMPGMPDTMPSFDGSVDMSMFGGNMADIFESATWENLIGSTAAAMPGWDGNGSMGTG
jgi:hypothetical protein